MLVGVKTLLYCSSPAAAPVQCSGGIEEHHLHVELRLLRLQNNETVLWQTPRIASCTTRRTRTMATTETAPGHDKAELAGPTAESVE